VSSQSVRLGPKASGSTGCPHWAKIGWESHLSLEPLVRQPLPPHHLLSPQRPQVTPKATLQPRQLVGPARTSRFGHVKVKKKRVKLLQVMNEVSANSSEAWKGPQFTINKSLRLPYL